YSGEQRRCTSASSVASVSMISSSALSAARASATTLRVRYVPTGQRLACQRHNREMRYENPLYMAEEAAAADLISGGRLQLGISRGSPEHADRGFESFGYVTPEGTADADVARDKAEIFRRAIAGYPMVRANPRMAGHDGGLAIEPRSPGLEERIWWGSGS